MLTDSVLMDVMGAVDKAARSGGLRPTRVDLQQLLPIQRRVLFPFPTWLLALLSASLAGVGGRCIGSSAAMPHAR